MEEKYEYLVVRPDLLVYFIKNYFLLILMVFIEIILGILVLLGYISYGYINQILIIFIITIILLALSAFYSVLFCKSATVTLENNQIVYQTGILSSKRKIISLDSIVDTSLDRSLLDKLFGSARINLSTAGSRSYEKIISNVKYDLANQMHEKIHEKIRARKKEYTKNHPT